MIDLPSRSLTDFPIVIALPVQWGDQDAFGHVNNTIFLRWFESGRIAYSSRIGLSTLMTTRRIGPILASVTCDFRQQVTFPETVQVGSRITRIGQSSIRMEHRLVAESSQAIAAEGSSTIVVFDYNIQKSVSVPSEVRNEIERLENRSFRLTRHHDPN